MEKQAYQLLRQAENSWWYQGRSWAVLAALRRAGGVRFSHILDYGAGYGGMYTTCASVAEAVDAFEPHEDAYAHLKARGYREVWRTEEEAFRATPEAIGLFDVLEHIEDDNEFLAQAYKALGDTGYLMLTVPAFPWLWSVHDKTHHHHRRYTKAMLRERLTAAGFDIKYLGYWNASLLLPALVLRLLGRSGEAGLAPAKPINLLLRLLLRIETFFIRFLGLPFGLSLVVVARTTKEKERRVTWFDKLRLLTRYGISGVIGGVIQTSTLFVWVSVLGLTSTYLLGLIVGFVLALIASFALQKYWTFRDRETSRVRLQVFSYTLVALSGLLLNTVLLASAKVFFERLSLDFFGGWYLVAQVVIVGIVSASNFLLNFLLTFRHARRTRSWRR